MFEFSMAPVTSPWPCCIGCVGTCQTPGRTFRFLPEARSVLPFGWGLSYTTFAYTVEPAAGRAAASVISLAPAAAFLAAHVHPKFGASFAPRHKAPVVLAFNVTVANTGARDAEDVVLGFLRPPGAGAGGIPLKFLFQFTRVAIVAGSSATVQLVVNAHDLTQVVASGERIVWPGEYTLEVGLRGAPAQGGGFATATFAASNSAASPAAPSAPSVVVAPSGPSRPPPIAGLGNEFIFREYLRGSTPRSGPMSPIA